MKQRAVVYMNLLDQQNSAIQASVLVEKNLKVLVFIRSPHHPAFHSGHRQVGTDLH